MEILVLLQVDEKEMLSGLEPSSTFSQVTSYEILLPFARKLGACWAKGYGSRHQLLRKFY